MVKYDMIRIGKAKVLKKNPKSKPPFIPCLVVIYSTACCLTLEQLLFIDSNLSTALSLPPHPSLLSLFLFFLSGKELLFWVENRKGGVLFPLGGNRLPGAKSRGFKL